MSTPMLDQSSDEWLQAAAALKSYVTAGNAYQNVQENTLVLDLTHSNLKQEHIEIRFDKHQTVDDLRHKIYQKTGTPHDFQKLQIFSGSTQVAEIAPSDPSTTKLGFFSLQHGMRVHCVDLNPNSISRGGALEDVSLVAKYKMSDEEYDKRKNTLRSWEQEQKQEDPTFTLAKYAKEHKALVEAKQLHKMGLPLPDGFQVVDGAVVKSTTNTEDTGPNSVLGIQIDMRCEAQPGGRRGTVKYVGEVPELGGFWIGISFDEPVGKSDGSVGGKQYFEAMAKFGGFCRGKNVQVGDFPERDLFEEDDDSSEDDEL
ncbi:Tubulin-folding cofactor B [Seminavis robusta]|uniref:Tubulin-folding cofactor B n=1 Tax=Seminavis robusta TaxID=568900 RepID=A0A9N8DG71_9STRA|nr:Tubulin-folding cofactor B [Seminavis robusta]|eukprot:Sro103_g052580.1 Tubulin-folding cofactor B (313) ;mRNA; r:83989-84927